MIRIDPLRNSKDYRLLFLSQFISYFGNMVSYVIVPYQVYELTKSSLAVGQLGFVQFFPVIVFGLLGGSFADRWNRKNIMVVSEILMSLCALGLLLNSMHGEPNLYVIYGLVFLMQSASAYHRPAMEAMTQKILSPEDFAIASNLSSMSYAITAIVGPALGGWFVAYAGTQAAYVFDLMTFVVSTVMLIQISSRYGLIVKNEATHFWDDLKSGLQFVRANKPLMGSYLVDIFAMIFAFPIALFPEIAATHGLKEEIGWLYGGMAIGALIVASTMSKQVIAWKSRGQAIIFAAAVWGVGILLFGLSLHSIIMSVLFLMLAGGADTISGLQRRILWNEIIPNSMRGRLAGLEMISYLSGPLLGNFRASYMASVSSVKWSIVYGGIVCIASVFLCAIFLPAFWRYQGPSVTS